MYNVYIIYKCNYIGVYYRDNGILVSHKKWKCLYFQESFCWIQNSKLNNFYFENFEDIFSVLWLVLFLMGSVQQSPPLFFLCMMQSFSPYKYFKNFIFTDFHCFDFGRLWCSSLYVILLVVHGSYWIKSTDNIHQVWKFWGHFYSNIFILSSLHWLIF